MKKVRNEFFDAGEYFSYVKREIEPFFFDITTMEERISLVETVLLKHFHPERENRILMNCMGELLKRQGNIKINKLAEEVHVSSRQIERIFSENIGITPKSFASLVRYQCVWREALYQRNFSVQDTVCKFGYTDQAHLLHEFRKYHRVTLREAVESARQNVAILQ